MKNLFKTAAAAGLAAMLLALTGCGESSGKKIRIGVAVPAADHGWTGGIISAAAAAKAEIEKQDPEVEIIIATARDAAEQVSRIENLLVRQVSALVVLPHEPGPLTAVCANAAQAGTFLVVVDRGLDRPVQNVSVAGDNRGFGRAAAQALAKALKGEGKILVMEGIPCVVNSDRVKAFNEELKKYPKIRILESQSAYWDTEKGLKLMENYLQKYPQIDAVWVGDDDVLIGALKALKESRRKEVKLMLGGGGAKHIVKRVMAHDPVVRMTVTYPPEMIAVGIREAIAGVRSGVRGPQKKIVVPSEIVTPANAAKFYHPESVY